MKGVIFNVLEDFIVENWGVETFETIFAKCPLHHRDGHIAPETYPDSDLTALVKTTCEELGIEPNQAIEVFGEYLFPQLARRYPIFLEGHEDPIEFLKTVDDVIHVEVRKLMQETALPKLAFHHDPENNDLIIDYRSKRQLCVLLKGLLAGVQNHFDANFEISEQCCVHAGADSCEFRIHEPHMVNEPA